MNSLTSAPIAQVLERLHQDAEAADRELVAGMDSGGGHLISSELQPGKVAKARANPKAAGLDALVDIREGDALETLGHLHDDVDLLLIDGAMTLYLPVLKLIEPRLRSGAVILAENAFEQRYLGHVRDPENSYLTMSLPDQQRGNEFTVRL